MHATNTAAEALARVEQENLIIQAQFEESKNEVKEQRDKLRVLEQQVAHRDLEIQHYKKLADEFNE